ncbi:MAG: DUF2130 domain-containing protein [bacterium]
MPTTIRCSKCQNEIEITEALKSELEEKVLQETEAKHALEVKQLLCEKEELERQGKTALEKAKQELWQEAQKKADEKAQREYSAKITLAKEEAEESVKQVKTLQENLATQTKELREARGAEGKLKLDFEQKLLAEQDKIKSTAKKEAREELNLTIAEKDKKLSDALKANEELNRKLKQGSQQLQGEVLELGLEGALRQEFPYDNISEVPKGIRGADIIQTVCTQRGASCGTIVWELKNTKNWIASWVEKLKNDQRELKANLAVIVSSVLPPNTNGFGRLGDILVCELKFAIPLAQTLREQLIGIHTNEQAHQGKSGKAEAVYDYLLSNNFRQRIEVWVEHFKDKQETLNKEKAYFVKKWAKEEQDLNKLRKSAIGLYGDLEGITGNALPKISYLELPESTESGEY